MDNQGNDQDAFLANLDASQIRNIIQNLETQLQEKDDTIDELRNDNLELKDGYSEMQIEYETKIETLSAQLESHRMENVDLKAHYQDAKEQLQILHGNEHEIESARKERHDALLQLQRLEQEHNNLTEKLHILSNENEQLRINLKDSQKNLSKLQTKLVSMQKDKREFEAKFSKYIQDSKLREEALHIEIEDLEATKDEYIKTIEQLRQGIMVSEQEKIKMQNDFTNATMDLLADDLNSSNSHGDRHGTMRLSALTAEDIAKQGGLSPNTGTGGHGIARQRTDSQFSVFSDADGNTIHGRNSSFQGVQFASRRMGSGSIGGLNDTLLDEMKTRNFHDRTESQVSIASDTSGHQARHSRQFSIGSTSDAIIQKLRVFLSRELIDQVKTMLGEELKNIDIKDQLDGVPEKLEKLLLDVLKKQNEISEKQNNKDELINKIETMITTTLTNTLNKINENNSNQEEIKTAMDDALQDIRNKLDTPSDALVQSLDDTLTNQMTALQVSIENQIDGSISSSIEHAMNDKVGKNINNIVNTQVKQPLETIHETVEKIYETVTKGTTTKEEQEENNSVLVEQLRKEMSTILDKQKEEKDDSEGHMQDRMDKFMELFRKEVIPEFAAMFENTSGIKKRSANTTSNSNKLIDSSDSSSSDNDNDDEKFNEHKNEYMARIEALQDRILELMHETKQLKTELQDAATSKASSLLRLQNLIDHLRFDNRVLQQQIERYRLQDAIYNQTNNNKSSSTSWMGNMFSGFGFGSNNSAPKVINVNVSNLDMANINQASTAAAEYTANAAVNVVARAVNAGVNGQNIST